MNIWTFCLKNKFKVIIDFPSNLYWLQIQNMHSHDVRQQSQILQSLEKHLNLSEVVIDIAASTKPEIVVILEGNTRTSVCTQW